MIITVKEFQKTTEFEIGEEHINTHFSGAIEESSVNRFLLAVSVAARNNHAEAGAIVYAASVYLMEAVADGRVTTGSALQILCMTGELLDD